MFGICSQKQGDVHSCIIHMKQRGHRYPVLQVSDKDYNELRFEKHSVSVFAHQKLATSTMVVNVETNTLHQKGCPLTEPQESIPCFIIDISKTGLNICDCCR